MSHYSKNDNRTTAQRGLGYRHQQRRKALMPAALNTPCPGPFHGPRSPRCTGLMTVSKLMHLDEDPPRALATPTRFRICCAPCNLSSGARLGNQLQAQKLGWQHEAPTFRQSRRWLKA